LWDHSSIFFPLRSELLVCPILVLATPIKILHSSRVLPFSDINMLTPVLVGLAILTLASLARRRARLQAVSEFLDPSI